MGSMCSFDSLLTPPEMTSDTVKPREDFVYNHTGISQRSGRESALIGATKVTEKIYIADLTLGSTANEAEEVI